MQKSERIAIEAMTREFRAVDWPFQIVNATRHKAVTVTAPDGSKHKIVVPSSGRSDANCQANFARQRAKRLIMAYPRPRRDTRH